ncbi:hypothetical protein [Lactobacillus xylocopicola]|uniref:Uncharacterized protein n=1 Tax=Lactobacillus xylocopicola TaxID=2976676 RepID=A0ABN6SMB8_9LACO|nr:hypothetical protein [Lactobacillus xylocopicola]BDR60201.1 hypothetical protein KIM322_04620 [Lactobacillus xylocopicola]
MRLTDFLQLTNDLNKQTTLYLTLADRVRPLTSLKISSRACVLYPGTSPMTLTKLTRLVINLHDRNLPLAIQGEGEQVPVYGIQIRPESNSIRLT